MERTAPGAGILLASIAATGLAGGSLVQSAGATTNCGDGVVDVDSGEQCDDGNSSNPDACDNQCMFVVPTCTIPTNGLVEYWPFNGNADDESGNGNNGSIPGPTGPTLAEDRFGRSMSA